jgi:hypothetical protein
LVSFAGAFAIAAEVTAAKDVPGTRQGNICKSRRKTTSSVSARGRKMTVPSNAGIVVTLVHGTWGRGIFPGLVPRFSSGPRWFEVKSVFRTQLQTLLSADNRPVVVREFHWSGSNSLRARQEAASNLAAELEEAKRQFPEYAHAVIGHSHGGNVALTALSKLEGVGRTWLLVTLATPFLSIRDADRQSPLVKRVEFFMGAFGMTFGMQALYLLISDPVPLVQSMLIDAALLTIFWILAIGFNTEIVSSKSDEIRTDASVLVLRSIDDEARLALAAGSIVSKLSYLLLSLIYFLLFGIGAVMAVLSVLATLALVAELIAKNSWLSSYVFSESGLEIVVIVNVAFKLLLGFMMIPLVFMALGRSVNGRELLFGGIVREINVQSVPDTNRRMEVRTLAPEPKSSSTLRHSIYKNALCGPEAARWLLAQSSEPGD